MKSKRPIPMLLACFATLLIFRFSGVILYLKKAHRAIDDAEIYRNPAVPISYDDVHLDPIRGINSSHLPESSLDSTSRCFQNNTRAWLQGPRLGNIREGISKDLVQKMLVDVEKVLSINNSLDILERSMCLKKSHFVSKLNETDDTDTKAVRIWKARLIYMAFHYHQHRFGAKEAASRSACKQEELDKYDIGPFDYECDRNAKYAIFDLGDMGIGANIRGGAAVAMMMGLLSDRVVLFINKAPVEHDVFRRWQLASCPRQDHQCFFFPPSPCVLTIDDINTAWIMPKHDSRIFLTKNGKLPREHENTRVIRVVSLFNPLPAAPRQAVQRLVQYAHELIDRLPTTDPRIPIMRKAAALVANDAPARANYDYAASMDQVAHLAGIYVMRPNPTAQENLENILSEVVPPDLDVETTIGLPIRASDKCFKESECLSFDQHMMVANDVWSRHRGSQLSDPSIIFTTESEKMVLEHKNFSDSPERQSKFPYRFQFITNERDITTNTGKLFEATRFGGADRVMLSAMSTLMLQMMPRYTIANCCSNFHLLLADYLQAGCGAASQNNLMCLQENPNPHLRVCCAWNGNCRIERQKLIEALARNGTPAQATP